MGKLIRQFDWNASPLGLPRHWPLPLKVAVQLILSSHHPMLVWWGDELIQFYNDAYRQTLGPERHPAALGQCGAQSWVEAGAIIEPELRHVMSGQGALWHEDRLAPVTRHGTRQDIWWNYSLGPIVDESAIRGVLAICSDVSAQHVLRESLSQSYHSLFGSMDQAFCVLELLYGPGKEVDDCRYIETNAAFAHQTGIRDAKGKRLRELTPEIDGDWLCRLGKTAQTGLPLHVQREVPWLKRWLDIDAFRIGDTPGNIVGVLFRDVTGQKRDEQALETSRAAAQQERARLQAILDAAPIAIGVADADGKLIHVNYEKRRLWGGADPLSFSASEYAQRKAWHGPETPKAGQLLSEDEWPLVRALRGEDRPRELIEIETLDTPSARKTVVASAAPVRDSEGALVGAVTVLMDISERVRAEEELRQANTRKDNFLAMLAHELRNPLAPIAAASELLAHRAPDPERVRQTTTIIGRQVKYMTELLDDLLEVTRIAHGLVVLQKRRIDLKDVIAHSSEQMHSRLEGRKHTLHVHCAPAPTIVYGDERRLVQVVVNLLNNAVKYTHPGGNIDLKLTLKDSQVEIAVRDNGIGMSAEMIDRVFDMFMQAERNNDMVQGGLGLGLALVRQLVELHGGTVRAESAGLDQGSTFTVALPRCEERAAAVVAPVPASSPRTLTATNVLIVDDNVDAAEMLAQCLESFGYLPRIANSATQAIDMANATPPDVCLLNIVLPDFDGYELARRLRANPRTHGATLVAVTGFAEEHESNDGYDTGINFHFVKPVDTQRLHELLAYGHIRRS